MVAPAIQTIPLDLNAGGKGQGAVAYALAHETTHFIKDFSPAKYEAYAELIIAAAENKGISYDSLLARQMARLSEMEEYKGKTETELQEIAYDETIAEMSETILTDTDAANRLSQEIYKQDRTLWQKIKDFFTGLVEKLRNAYKDSDPDSDIGRILKQAVRDNEQIAQAWAEAVSEAGENYQLQDGQKKNAREGVRYSERANKYSYEYFTAKEDMAVTSVDENQSADRASIVQAALRNAKEVGQTNENGNALVYVDDIGKDVLVGKKAISHGLDRRTSTQAPVLAKIGDVLKNAVRVNELNPRSENIKESYILVGAAQSEAGLYVASFVVNRHSNEITSIDVLYAANAKKEPAALLPKVTEESATPTGSKISIAKLLDVVNELYPDILPEDVLKHYGHSSRPGGKLGESVLYSSRTDSTGRTLSEAQAKYFENSEVRDEDGNLLPVYHRTDNEFYTFDRNQLGGNALGNATDAAMAATALVGHWFSDHDVGDALGSRGIQSYVNIENPYSTSLTELAEAIKEHAENAEQMQDDYDSGDYAATRQAADAFVDWLRGNGYDGLIVTDEEFGGNSYVVLDSEQAKLTTNENPTGSEDIRYSDRNSQSKRVEQLEKKNAELKAEAEYLKQVVKIQKSGNRAHILDRNSVNAIGKGLMESVNAKGSEFGKLLNDFYRTLGTEEMSYETMQDKAGELAEWLLDHHQAERDGYAQEVLDFLKKRRVSLSDSQIGDIEYSYGDDMAVYGYLHRRAIEKAGEVGALQGMYRR